MNKCPSSIFNDVIGPIMRGPSSSHVAAAQRIALLIRQAVGNDPKKVICQFDPIGSLAETYHSQGSDMGFAGGLLGMELTDERMNESVQVAQAQGIQLHFEIVEYGAKHPNDYKSEAWGTNGTHHHIQCISTGGGMVAMEHFDGYPVDIHGDYYELLIKYNSKDVDTTCVSKLLDNIQYVIPISKENCGEILLNIKLSTPVTPKVIQDIEHLSGINEVTYLCPIVPTLSSKDCNVPFKNAKELVEYSKNEGKGLEMWQLAAKYEAMRGCVTEEDVYNNMGRLLDIMMDCVKTGLAGTEYEDRILGYQSYMIDNASDQGLLLPSTVINNVIKCITAIMEVKSSMGVIVAAPTAGSCGCLPGTVIGIGMTYSFDRDKLIKALLAGGMIGAIFAELATFAAEVAGCQVECGAGSGMTAAAVAQLFGGSPEQCINAASVALQNVTGLCCDPVAVRVEVPCLGKNIMGGSNAISAANMILAGYDYVIPLDQTIKAMLDIGLQMPQEIKCTLGGLGKTPASFDIAKRLK